MIYQPLSSQTMSLFSIAVCIFFFDISFKILLLRESRQQSNSCEPIFLKYIMDVLFDFWSSVWRSFISSLLSAFYSKWNQVPWIYWTLSQLFNILNCNQWRKLSGRTVKLDMTAKLLCSVDCPFFMVKFNNQVTIELNSIFKDAS